MHVNARHARTIACTRGFSLLEVVIAAALLLMTVTAVTSTVVNASRAGSRLARTMTVDRVLRGEVERLRALPYCAASYPAMTEAQAAAGGPATDVVGDLFPHTVLAANLENARYVVADITQEEPAGSFVSTVQRDGVTITRVARFLAAGGSVPMGPDAVAGWTVWGDSLPPASTVEVRVTAVAAGMRRECRIVCAALPPTVAGYGDVADGRTR